MIVMIDNYDSFTYNLVQYFGESGEHLRIYRNDAITVADLTALQPEAIVLSPGPCTPNEAGIGLELVRAVAGEIPLLGVCLGHQTIAHAFGGKVVHAKKLMHGKTSPILHDGKGVFAGLPSPFTATRYHSLTVERESLPPCFEISAETEDGEIMGIRHRDYCVEGVQFHPESIATEGGKKLLANFLRRARAQSVC